MRYVIILLSALTVTELTAAAPQRIGPVEEGYLVGGIEGRVVQDPDTMQWEFFPGVQISDGKGLLPADKGIAFLPCSTLEQISRAAGDARSMDMRLWAMVTEFRGRNFLFGLYFLPMKTQDDSAAPKPAEPAPAEPQDKESVLPDEILQMMQRTPIPDLKRLDDITVVSTDRNLIHRSGLMSGSDEGFIFALDAFGRNVEQESYRLLPSKTLERIRRSMQQTLGRQRFVVSGVITQFEGETFLLVRRAVRTYTHGNFTP